MLVETTDEALGEDIFVGHGMAAGVVDERDEFHIGGQQVAAG
jgi:hypothetical protein